MLDNVYNPDEGPLWCVKLLPWSPAHAHFTDAMFVPAEHSLTHEHIPEPTKHPNVCHVVMGFHHAITDAHSNIRLTRDLLQLINSILSGNPVDDQEQTSRLISEEGREQTMTMIENRFRLDDQLLNDRVKNYQNCFRKTLIEEVFPIERRRRSRLVPISYCLDKRTNSKFIKCCREVGITFHSGFCSIINAAIIKVLEDNDIKQQYYNIAAMHAIDNRNLHGEGDDSYGYCISVIDLNLEVSTDILTDFWKYANEFHSIFKRHCKNNYSLDHEVIWKLKGINVIPSLPEERSDKPSSQMVYYNTSNALNIGPLLDYCGETVHLEYIDRISKSHSSPILWLNNFQTLGGRLFHTLLYNESLIDREVAQNVSDTMFSMLREVIC